MSLTVLLLGTMNPPPPPPASSLFGRHIPRPASSPEHESSLPFSGASGSSLALDYSTGGARTTESEVGVRSARTGGAMSINSIVDLGTHRASQPPAWSPYIRRASPKGFNSKTTPSSPAYHQASRRESGILTEPSRHSFSSASPLKISSEEDDVTDRITHGFLRSPQQAQRSPTSPAANKSPPRPYSQSAPSDPNFGPPSLLMASEKAKFVDRQRHQSSEESFWGTHAKSSRDRSVSDLDGRGPAAVSQPLAITDHEQALRRLVEPPQAPQSNLTVYQGQDEGTNVIHAGDSLRYDSIQQSRSRMENAFSPTRMDQEHALRQNDSLLLSDGPLRPEESSAHNRPYEAYTSPGTHLDRSFSRSSPVIDSQLRRSIEEHQFRHRSYLGVTGDYVRNERASPLPQAVQGAQSQPVGSGRDPGIKSEFGKMFSGLGSGVGSTPQPSMPSHGAPPLQSPDGNGLNQFREDRDMTPTSRRPPHIVEREKNSSFGSRGMRRNKRPLGEDGRQDSDSGDGGGTPATSNSRATKRNKYSQPTVPHHHHHVTGLQSVTLAM